MKDPLGPPIALVSVTLLALAVIGAAPRPASTAPATPATARPRAHVVVPRMFETSDACLACHNGLSTASGEDVSIGTAWRASIMANSARDPYWQASVRREVLEHPGASAEIEDECSTCHMPMMRAQARAEGRRGEVFARLPIGRSAEPADLLAADGVSCTLCHQIQRDRLGTSESFVGGFVVDTVTPFGSRSVFGPFVIDSGRQRIMHSSSDFRPTEGAHIRTSELCATCHTLYTEARDAGGRVIGRLPEQMPYLEWRRSIYAEGTSARSCQSCHMPAVAESIAIAGVWGRKRERLARHDFRGGNFFMLRMLNRYRAELGVEAPGEELDAAAHRTIAHLQTDAARVAIEGARLANGRIALGVRVRNLTGHKLPTAYPSRRAWLHLVVRDGAGRVLFESGALGADGSIVGNDNDADALALEPHRAEITKPDEVQIYESIMADSAGRVTTGLLSAVRFIKDNRILPAGFDKRGAPEDIAVRGPAADDADFTGGSDRVGYDVAVASGEGPYTIEAELWYQPIAFRWAHNLSRHRASEITRFVAAYESMAHASAVVLARDSARVVAPASVR